MKLFTRISLILAGVLAGIGVLLCIVASVMGGGVHKLLEAGVTYGNWHIGWDGIYYSDRDRDTEGESSVSYTYETAGIRNLEIDMEAAEVYVEEGAQTDTVVVHMYRGREQDYKEAVTADGTLSLAYHRSGDWSNRSNTEFVIELPSGLALSDVKLELDAAEGQLSLADMRCEKLTVTVDAASAVLEDFTVSGETIVLADTGNAELLGGTYQNLEIDCDMGNVSVEGAAEGDITAKTSMGNVALSLSGDAAAYRYELSCDMGELTVNGRDYSSISADYEPQNAGAEHTAALSCDMGSLELTIQ